MIKSISNKRCTQPLVSVCIPTSNSAKFIVTALGSVINQTYKNIEILIVDNNSNDETISLINNFSDPRIHILKIKNYGSIAASRNLAIKSSKAEWIAFLDSDDFWSLNKLETCSKYFNNSVDFIYHNLYVVTKNSNEVQGKLTCKKLRKPIFENLISDGNRIATSSVVVKKKLLEEVNYMNETLDMAGTEDYNTWLKISQLTDNFKRINRYLGSYRIHDQNFSKKTNSTFPLHAIDGFIPQLDNKVLNQLNSNRKYTELRMNYMQKSNSMSRIEIFKLFTKTVGLRKYKVLYMAIFKK